MDKVIMLIDSAIDTLCEVGNGVTEKDLHEAATVLFEARERLYKIRDEEFFDLVSGGYRNVNHEFIQKQCAITAEYLTEEQKAELRRKGIKI